MDELILVYEKASDANSSLQVIEELARAGICLILIISDWLMPGMKGDEILDIVKRNNPEIKAIMITGHADTAALEKVRTNTSVIGILKKPWNALELKNLISAHCIESC